MTAERVYSVGDFIGGNLSAADATAMVSPSILGYGYLVVAERAGMQWSAWTFTFLQAKQAAVDFLNGAKNAKSN